MPIKTKSAAQEANAGDAVPFEQAMQRLESIVEEMESGDIPLETLLTRFEEGTRLVRHCQTKLGEAEVKIQKLEKSASGEPVLQPMPDAPSDDE